MRCIGNSVLLTTIILPVFQLSRAAVAQEQSTSHIRISSSTFGTELTTESIANDVQMVCIHCTNRRVSVGRHLDHSAKFIRLNHWFPNSTQAHALSKQVNEHYLPKLMSHTPDGYTTEDEISMRNRFNNVDGFGIVWYTKAQQDFNGAKGGRPAMYKHGKPPTNDYNFHSICANTSTTTTFGHIRAATATPVTEINNHPFVFGRHSIMHNGVISNFIDIKREVLEVIGKDAFENIHGGTDSEHLAALYVTCLTNSGGPQTWEQQYPVTEMAAALGKAIKIVIGLQQKVLGIKNAEANSLNVACTDGEQMIAFRFRNHQTEQPPSLYWSNTAGVTLNRKYPDHPNGDANPKAYKEPEEHGKHMIVASEPTTYKEEEWNLIPKNHCCMVGKDGFHEIEQIEVAMEHMAQAKTTQHG